MHTTIRHKSANLPAKTMIKLTLLSGVILFLIYALTPVAEAAFAPLTPSQVLGDTSRVKQALAAKGIYQQIYQESVDAYQKGDRNLAYRQWFMLARKGHTPSQYMLGNMYMHGEGINRDPAFAIHWYTKAANNGHRQAQYNLGIAYAQGIGVTVDISRAIQWWKAAAKQGSPDAQYNLGLVYSQGYGVEKNATEALRWYLKAAAHGDPAAQYNLGVMYARGDGVARNMPEAIKWWNRSANQGFKHAKNALKLLGLLN